MWEVTLDRPPVNAVNQEMYREIKALFDELSTDSSVDVVILAGAGKHFCAGNDLDEFMTLSPQNSPARMQEVREAFEAIYDCAVPVIAAVQGTAVGTGLSLLACCDFAIGSEDARIGVPEVSVGVMGAANHLSRLMPQPLVRSMYFTADPLPAAEFARFGGLIAVVERDRLTAEARGWAAKIARHSSQAIRYAKRGLNQIEPMELKEGYQFEQGLTGELSGHPDSKEALKAFFERREPRYERPSRD